MRRKLENQTELEVNDSFSQCVERQAQKFMVLAIVTEAANAQQEERADGALLTFS